MSAASPPDERERKKQMLAEALRQYPTWGDAYIACVEALRDVQGSLLAYWTDLSEAEIQRLLAVIQKVAP